MLCSLKTDVFSFKEIHIVKVASGDQKRSQKTEWKTGEKSDSKK